MAIVLILLLLLEVCFCADISADLPPNYYQAKQDVEHAIKMLNKHLISMGDSVPELLTDYRRQYAVICHVIYKSALQDSGCRRRKTSAQKLYERNLADFVPEALRYPGLVVNETRKFIDDYHNNTLRIKSLIHNVCKKGNSLNCNNDLHATVTMITGALEIEAKILLAAGATAVEFFKKHGEFLTVSKGHKAVQYVNGSPDKLKNIILKLKQLMKAIHPDRWC